MGRHGYYSRIKRYYLTLHFLLGLSTRIHSHISIFLSLFGTPTCNESLTLNMRETPCCRSSSFCSRCTWVVNSIHSGLSSSRIPFCLPSSQHSAPSSFKMSNGAASSTPKEAGREKPADYVYFERTTAGFSDDAIPRSKTAQLKLQHFYKVAVDSAIERNQRYDFAC
jgi:hypothetical protein